MCKYNTEEVWKDIEGFEGIYQVSNFGRVKSLDREITNLVGRTYSVKGVVLRQTLRNGYQRVILSLDGKATHVSVHRLVALAFVDNPENKEYVHHIDSDKMNNHMDNLEWATPLENSRDARINNLYISGSRSPDSKLEIEVIPNILDLYFNKGLFQSEIGEKYNVSQSMISHVIRGESWHYEEDSRLEEYLNAVRKEEGRHLNAT